MRVLAASKLMARRFLSSPLVTGSLTAIGGTAATIISLHLPGLGHVPYTLAHIAVGSGLFLGTCFATGRALGRTTAASIDSYPRGAVIARGDEWQQASEKAAARELTLAGLRLSSFDETKHFKFIGTTGTGKSTAIGQLLEQALAREDRAIIADPDGGYLRRFYRPERGDVILNPFDQRSVKWDLFAEIRREYDVDQLARSLIPDQEAGDRIWRGYGRTFFTAVTRQAHASGVTDVKELFRLLTMADTQELRTLTRGTPAQAFLEPDNAKMFRSLQSVTSSAVASLEYIRDQQGASFSIRDWVDRGPKDTGVLFIPYRAGQIAALRSTISAWMRIGIFAAMDRAEQDQRLWFVVDELDALGPIDGLKDALARVRKFGGRCVLGFQSVAQVASAYGSGDAHTIVENCGNTFIFRCSASEGGGTARFASTLIGQREVRRTMVSTSRQDTHVFGSSTRSDHINVEPAVLDSEIEQIPDLCGYLKLASRPDWVRLRISPPQPAPTGMPEIQAYVEATKPARTSSPAVATPAPVAAKRARRTVPTSVTATAADALPVKRRARTRRAEAAAPGAEPRQTNGSTGLEL